MIYYLPMEVEVRDLEPRLYIAARLASAGQKVVTGEKIGVHLVMEEEKEEFVYLDKGLEVRKLGNYRQMIARGGRIVLLDEEGGIYPDGRIAELLTLSRASPKVLPYVSAVCCWGREQMGIVKKQNSNYPTDRLHVTGHPRFDMRKPEFGSYFDALNGRDGPLKRSGVLVNMSFGTANNRRFPDVEDMIADYCPGLAEVASYNELADYYRRRFRHQQSALESMLEAVDYCANELPREQFVVRPHPVERREVYEEAFRDRNNIIVRGEGSVHNEMSRVKAMIHYDCTTAVEAAFMGLSPISFSPDIDPGVMQMLPVRISQRATTKWQLKEELANVLGGGRNGGLDESKRELIKQRIDNFDGSAVDRIVEVLLQTPEYDGNRNWFTTSLAKHHVRSAFRHARSVLKRGAPKNDKFSELEISMIERRLNAFTLVDKRVKVLSLDSPRRNTFVLNG